MPPQTYSAEGRFDGSEILLPKEGSLAIGESNSPTDYKYTRYTNIANRRLSINVNAGGNFPIPMIPGTDRLRCSDNHFSYGVWVKYRRNTPTPEPPLWIFYDGGGLTLSDYFHNGKPGCRTNFSPSITNRYYWGRSNMTLDFRGLPDYLTPEELVVGTLGRSNGFGSGRCEFQWYVAQSRPSKGEGGGGGRNPPLNCSEPVSLRVSDITNY